MANKEKALKREITRLRKTQNPQQIDLRRMRRARAAKTEMKKLRKKPTLVEPEAADKTKEPKEKKKAEPKKKEPELEVVKPGAAEKVKKPKAKKKEKKAKPKKEKEPDLEVIDDDLDDLYTYDEEIDIDDEDE
ncbi:hypothetical protein EU546_01400 [Candidatus Thorarchaeota archaeon]|nr:MAG: hypothetical protein EU546_01400 [Candidatus Thorarchaeota archaeon]